MSEELPLVREEVVNSLGFWTAEEQQVLETARVAVAGLGGAGGMVVELLGRCGVAKWSLADPDRCELANIGRQAGSGYDTIGMHKVDVMTSVLKRVNRESEVQQFHDGVMTQNIDEFLAGADVVLDAIDIEHAWLSVRLGRRAADLGIPMVTALEIGDGCQYTAFRADSAEDDASADAYFGTAPGQAVANDTQIETRALLSFVPHYFPPGLLDAVEARRVRTPAHAIGVARNASAVARAIRELILRPHHEHDFYYPNLIVDDPDPAIGTFVVSHDDRRALLRDSLRANGRRTDANRFSPIGTYRVIDGRG